MSIWGQGRHFESQKLPSKKVSKFLLGRTYKGAVSTGQTIQQACSSVDLFVDTTLKPFSNCLQLQVPITSFLQPLTLALLSKHIQLHPPLAAKRTENSIQRSIEAAVLKSWELLPSPWTSMLLLRKAARYTWQWLWLTSPILWDNWTEQTGLVINPLDIRSKCGRKWNHPNIYLKKEIKCCLPGLKSSMTSHCT